MYVKRVRIENFRNFRRLDVELEPNVVVVGENKAGKSNFLHALRLVLDPSLPDSARQLRLDDFHDQLPRPLAPDQQIVVAVDLTGFENDDAQLALLADYLVEPSPMVARLTYLFRPKAAAKEPIAESDYEFLVYGGDREDNPTSYDVRRRAPLHVVHALRDAEGDLASWRRSPLRPLLTSAAARVDISRKGDLARLVDAATAEVTKESEVAAVQTSIADMFTRMVGAIQATDIQLKFAPTDAERLIRALRLFVDGGLRGVAEASLGVANTLYLVLKLLEIEELIRNGERDQTFLSIEEPEAHLHPQLQRNIFRAFLRPRLHVPAGEPAAPTITDRSTTLLTTHSPHIASVTPLRSFVLLRRTEKGTEGTSTATLALDKTDADDLERYLDVTRGELLFARGVVLVEGAAEAYVVPALAALLAHDLDSLGISVCSVAGAYFGPYVKFLRQLGIPFVVLTDRDPKGATTPTLGETRVCDLLPLMIPAFDPSAWDVPKLLGAASGFGCFLNSTTFEVDLFRAGWQTMIGEALTSLTTNGAAQKRAAGWAANPTTLDEEAFLGDVGAIGKGRFGQRVASMIPTSKVKGAVPPYIADAITSLVKLCR